MSTVELDQPINNAPTQQEQQDFQSFTESQFNRINDWLESANTHMRTADFYTILNETIASSEAAVTDFDDSIFTSVLKLNDAWGFVSDRRKWSAEGPSSFRHDWRMEIELSGSLNKKPTVSGIKAKFAMMPDMKERWASLTAYAIKEKIWVEAQRINR